MSSDDSDPAARYLAWLGLGLAVLTPLTVWALPPGVIRALVVVAFACAAPGAATLCWFYIDDVVVRCGLVVVISLAVFGAVAVTMVWLHRWHPVLGTDLIALTCAIAAGMRLRASSR